VLLISKVTLSAGFTLAGTAAVERLGPRIGGLVAAVPQLAVASPSRWAMPSTSRTS
jgi:hypothetical protein